MENSKFVAFCTSNLVRTIRHYVSVVVFPGCLFFRVFDLKNSNAPILKDDSEKQWAFGQIMPMVMLLTVPISIAKAAWGSELRTSEDTAFKFSPSPSTTILPCNNDFRSTDTNGSSMVQSSSSTIVDYPLFASWGSHENLTHFRISSANRLGSGSSAETSGSSAVTNQTPIGNDEERYPFGDFYRMRRTGTI
ncbi:hypothetical protein FPQ18DRAFT_338745 [Pyronema domesticum]|nr:hypothetical protein FPQ18DRAFT_338745 [Pyronema domesticum]